MTSSSGSASKPLSSQLILLAPWRLGLGGDFGVSEPLLASGSSSGICLQNINGPCSVVSVSEEEYTQQQHTVAGPTSLHFPKAEC